MKFILNKGWKCGWVSFYFVVDVVGSRMCLMLGFSMENLVLYKLLFLICFVLLDGKVSGYMLSLVESDDEVF